MVNKKNSNLIQDSLQAWIISLTGTLFFFLESIRVNMYDVLSAKLIPLFSINAYAYGKLSASYLLINIILLFPAGLLLDRFSTKKILILAQLLALSGTVCLVSAQGYKMLLISSITAGIGGTFAFLSAIRLVRYCFSAAMLGKVTGIIVTFAMLGGLVAHIPLLTLIDFVGWREALIVFLGVEMIIIITSVFIIPDRHTVIHSTPKVMHFWRDIKTVLFNLQNWLGGVYTSLMNLPVTLLGAVWGGTYLQQIYHFSPLQASIITSYIFIGMMVGCPLTGIISDSIHSRKIIMIIGAMTTFIVMLLLLKQIAFSQDIIAICFFALGLFSSTQVLGYTIVAESNDLQHSSAAMGIAGILVMSGGTFLQPLFGKILQSGWSGTMINGMPYYSDSNFFHALLIFPIAFFIALIASFFIKDTFLKQLPEINKT